MKKIMFDDKFMLTQAVLEGRKTQTRRIIKTSDAFERVNTDFDWSKEDIKNWEDDFVLRVKNMSETERKECFNYLLNHPKYKVGEIVAVAQSYCSIADELENCNNATCAAHYEKNIQKASEYISWMEHPGFNNKLFVAADRMIHEIRITNVRIERLQDISDEDCLKESVVKCDAEDCNNRCYLMSKCDFCHCGNAKYTPREAYAALIDKVGKKGTWDSNPYVFVYDFELVK